MGTGSYIKVSGHFGAKKIGETLGVTHKARPVPIAQHVTIKFAGSNTKGYPFFFCLHYFPIFSSFETSSIKESDFWY